MNTSIVNFKNYKLDDEIKIYKSIKNHYFKIIKIKDINEIIFKYICDFSFLYHLFYFNQREKILNKINNPYFITHKYYYTFSKQRNIIMDNNGNILQHGKYKIHYNDNLDLVENFNKIVPNNIIKNSIYSVNKHINYNREKYKNKKKIHVFRSREIISYLDKYYRKNKFYRNNFKKIFKDNSQHIHLLLHPNKNINIKLDKKTKSNFKKVIHDIRYYVHEGDVRAYNNYCKKIIECMDYYCFKIKLYFCKLCNNQLLSKTYYNSGRYERMCDKCGNYFYFD